MSETATQRDAVSRDDWRTVRIGNAFEMQLGKMLSKAAKTGRNSKYYLANRNVQWDRADVSALEIMDFSESEQEKFSLRSGDLLVCEGGEVGRTCLWRAELSDCFFQKAIHRLRPATSDVLPEYMLRLMRLMSDNGAFTAFTSQSSIAHLTREKLALVQICVPPLPQQRKIARILTTLDNVITQTEALIAKYQAIKQGLMHDLFTRGVDATGKLRPPQSEAPELYKQSELGWIPKEWEVVRLADYLDRIEQGWSPNCESEPASAGEWGVLKTTAVVWEGFNCHENKRLPRHLPPLPQYEVHVDDVLMTRGGPNSRVGVVVHVQQTTDKLMLSDKIYRLIPRKGLIPRYLALALSSGKTQTHLSTLKTGLAESQTNISQEIVRRLWVGLRQLSEQHAICKMIDVAENVVASERRSLEAFRVGKTGLMQDLLTGKVRVNVEV